jgi:hypothetical protein
MMSPYLLLGTVLVFGLVTFAVLALSSRRNKARSEYRAVPLLSPGEAELYRCLIKLYGTGAIICPKVRLVDLIRPHHDMDRSKFQTAFNRVSSKHVDFVILGAEDLTVLGVVELDDRSHERESRASRDGFVDDALHQAGIRMCRIKARRHYDPEPIYAQLNEALTARVSANTGA